MYLTIRKQDASRTRRLWCLAVVLCCVWAGNRTFAAAPGRAIVQDGTVKTADGQLLRGCHAHIATGGVTAEIRNFFMDLNNVIKMRDEGHLNALRITCLTWNSTVLPTVDEALTYVDKMVDNCESAGVYAIVNYHGTIHVGGEWDWLNFWTKVAARYRDRTHVIYNLLNESMQCGCESCYLPTHPSSYPTGWAVNVAQIAEVHKAVRAAAPNTMIWGVEPVNIECDWGGWLVDFYAPQCGFDWEDGKDAFSFHTYGASDSVSIMTTMAHGVPVVNSEYSFPQEWPDGSTMFGTEYHSEFMEKNGVAHFYWQRWQNRNANQLQGILELLIPDAMAKGYAWWNAPLPTSPRNVTGQATSTYSIRLSWDEPSSVGNGIIRYNVFRDGEKIAETAGRTYTDGPLPDNATYGYEIMALASGSVRSPKSQRVDVSTGADQSAPTVVSANGAGDGRMVYVTFSEPMDPASAQTASNYALDKGKTISAATLKDDNVTVKLTTSYMTTGEDYTLTINNVGDGATTPNTVAPNTAVTFTCVQGVTKIRYCPRITYTDRMEGGVFEGTNGDKDTGPYTVLHLIPPLETRTDQWNAIVEFNAGVDIGYRCIRYRGPDGAHCSIADMDFWYGNIKATGTPFGSAASSSSNGLTNVFDGNIQTFYDASAADGSYIGLELDKTVQSRHGSAQHSPRSGPAMQLWHRRGRLNVVVDGLHPHASARIELYSTQGELRARFDADADDAGRSHATLGSSLGAGQYLVVVRAGPMEMVRRFGYTH